MNFCSASVVFGGLYDRLMGYLFLEQQGLFFDSDIPFAFYI